MDRKDKRFTVTLAPVEYRAIRELATDRHPGDSERTAITRYIEEVLSAHLHILGRSN